VDGKRDFKKSGDREDNKYGKGDFKKRHDVDKKKDFKKFDP
jgi:hypothetical protein